MKKISRQSFKFKNPVFINEVSSIVGPKEAEGPLKSYFRNVENDISLGKKTWEQAESALLSNCVDKLLLKTNLQEDEIDIILAGDLLNQVAASSFGIRKYKIPFLGLFSACATYTESFILASTLIDGGFSEKIISVVSSHFNSAERTFRTPLELGSQRPLSSSWTVTGSGSALLSNKGDGPRIESATIGLIQDFKIKDPTNMAAAMAPAAASSIKNHLKDTNRSVGYYDLILTGDLGHLGSKLLISLLEKDSIFIKDIHRDCGKEIFDQKTQETHNGGSGPACPAVVFNSFYYEGLKNNKFKKILFLATGALFSQVSSFQGETIPSIAHAVSIVV